MFQVPCQVSGNIVVNKDNIVSGLRCTDSNKGLDILQINA